MEKGDVCGLCFFGGFPVLICMSCVSDVKCVDGGFLNSSMSLLLLFCRGPIARSLSSVIASTMVDWRQLWRSVPHEG